VRDDDRSVGVGDRFGHPDGRVVLRADRHLDLEVPGHPVGGEEDRPRALEREAPLGGYLRVAGAVAPPARVQDGGVGEEGVGATRPKPTGDLACDLGGERGRQAGLPDVHLDRDPVAFAGKGEGAGGVR